MGVRCIQHTLWILEVLHFKLYIFVWLGIFVLFYPSNDIASFALEWLFVQKCPNQTQYFREMHVDVHLKLVDIYRRFLIHSRVNLRLGSQMNRLLDNDEWFLGLFFILNFCWTCYQKLFHIFVFDGGKVWSW